MGDNLQASRPLQFLTSHSGQLSLLPVPKCSDALRLGSKGRYGSLHLWINVWLADKTVWSVVNTFHTRSLYRWVSHDKALYKYMFTLLYFTVRLQTSSGTTTARWLSQHTWHLSTCCHVWWQDNSQVQQLLILDAITHHSLKTNLKTVQEHGRGAINSNKFVSYKY